MAHVQTIIRSQTTPKARRAPLARAVDLLAGSLLLAICLPLMAILALAVRRSSNGPILHRERTHDRRGRPVEVLSFRTTIDGASTPSHERLRAVFGAGDELPMPAVGRLMRATRTDRLPRLFSVVAGHASLI